MPYLFHEDILLCHHHKMPSSSRISLSFLLGLRIAILLRVTAINFMIIAFKAYLPLVVGVFVISCIHLHL